MKLKQNNYNKKFLELKTFIIIVFVFCFNNCLSQKQNLTELKLFVYDCRNTNNSVYINDTIYFSSTTNNLNAYKLIPKQFSQNMFKLVNIPVEDYLISFKNKFNQEISKRIKLKKENVNEVRICLDSLLNYPQNTLVNLKTNDTLIINYTSSGCFHSNSSKVEIIKLKENYCAKLYKGKYGSNKYSLLKTIILSKENLKCYLRFENEINFVNDGGCTTVDEYKIKSKYINKMLIDETCNWNGFIYLCKNIFGDIKLY